VVEFDEDELGEDLCVDDGADAVGGSDFRAAVGELFFQFLIGGIFVAQAAHESAASAGDFERVQSGFLCFGRSHGDGFEHFQKLFAAAVLATAFIVGDEFGLIPGADLSHFDTCGVFLGQNADHFSEIDTVV